MLQLEVLIFELVAIDGFATSAIVVGKVTSLAHELGDNAVESGSLVAESPLAGAESAEVFGCPRHDISTQLQIQYTNCITRDTKTCHAIFQVCHNGINSLMLSFKKSVQWYCTWLIAAILDHASVRHTKAGSTHINYF